MARLTTATASHVDNGDKSPTKSPQSPFQAGHRQLADRGAPFGAPQHSLRLQHVDSLLLPKLASSFKHRQLSQTQNLHRATPQRAAKRDVRYEATDLSPSDSPSELRDSEWEYSVESSRDDSTDGSDSSELPLRPVGVLRPRLKSKTLQSRFASGQVPRDVQGTRRPCSSSDHDSDAILRFSPPRTKSPFKKPPAARPTTPSPPASPTKSRLTSPKKLQRIPATPHRPSIDAFWSADIVNAWNDEYSPRKTLKSPIKHSVLGSSSDDDDTFFTPTTSPRKSPTKKDAAKRNRAAVEAKKAFESSKHATAEAFLGELDERITKGEIAKLTAATGGVKIVWSKKLNSTAGRAHWKREAIKPAQLDTSDSAAAQEPKTCYRNFASVELADKVIDDEVRLLNVLAHEFCHLANFMISGVKDQPHGTSFKRWAALVSSAFAEREVVVTTKHSYEIQYKYAWRCCSPACGVEYARHSRSIDPKKHTCGKCRGRLEQIRPAPRKAHENGTTDGAAGATTEYQRFVKEQFGTVRSELGQQSPMKDVMREIGARYRMKKNQPVTKELCSAEKENAGGADPAQKVDRVGSEGEVAEDGGHGKGSPCDSADNDSRGNVDSISRILTFLTISDH